MSYTILTGIWEEVDDEIRAAQKKHGPRSMRQRDTFDAVVPLTEEVGEVAQAACQWRDEGKPITRVRHELVQLAASAVAMIQHIDAQAQDALEAAQRQKDRERALEQPEDLDE